MSSELSTLLEAVPFLPHSNVDGESYVSEPRAGGESRLPLIEGSACMGPLKARQHAMLLSGREVMDLSMVNPDLPPPRAVLDRLLEYVTKTSTHRYAVSRGVRRLREGFAEKYHEGFGVQLDPEREVCVCLGSKDAMYHALRALTRRGDAVIMSAPTYPAHLSAVHLVGARPFLWNSPEDPAEAARSLAQLLSSTESRLVILNFPSNPTGRVVSQEWLRAVVKVAREHRAFVVNDFVYGEMCFGGKKAPSILNAASGELNGLLEVYSLSKAYNVPGWRVGALSGDSRVVKEVAHQKSIADYGLFLPLQYAASLALTSSDDLVRHTVTQYERRLKIVSKGLSAIGWRSSEPKAGASLWTEFPASLLGLARSKSRHSVEERSDSVAVAELLLEEAGVLCTPGTVFGSSFDSYIRFTAVVPEERMRDAVAAIGNLV